MAETFASQAAIFVIDDTSFPKQGKLSAGVQRQYCGASGKKANCQVAPSVHYVSPKGHYPLAMRLYLPESWAGDGDRLDRAGVPDEHRKAATKGQIALELLDQVRGEGLAGHLVLADAGYGVSGPFRDGLASRGLHYIVGVTEEMVVFAEQPKWEAPAARPAGAGGRPPKRSKLPEGAARPVSLKAMAAATPLRKVTWREGTKGPLSGRFAWVRVWPGGGWATGGCAGAEPLWLLIEEQADGKIKYALSNLPGRTSRIKAVRLWKSRWPVEQGYQQMKEELGLDHHEGRSWRGFHHHACLVMQWPSGSWRWRREREERDPAVPGKKGIPARRSRSRRSDGHCSECSPRCVARLPVLPKKLLRSEETANGVVLRNPRDRHQQADVLVLQDAGEGEGGKKGHTVTRARQAGTEAEDGGSRDRGPRRTSGEAESGDEWSAGFARGHGSHEAAHRQPGQDQAHRIIDLLG